MAAEFKSHVLRRDEKGLLGIPFKRWLLAGVGGGMVFACGGLVPGGLGIPLACLVAFAILILTGERHGMPLWLRLMLGGRGRLMVQAERHPSGLAGQLAHSLELPVEQITHLDGAQLFAPPDTVDHGDLTEWISRRDPQRLDDDLIVVTYPLASVDAEQEALW